jgi:hypothetical protein
MGQSAPFDDEVKNKAGWTETLPGFFVLKIKNGGILVVFIFLNKKRIYVFRRKPFIFMVELVGIEPATS